VRCLVGLLSLFWTEAAYNDYLLAFVFLNEEFGLKFP